MSEVRVTHTPDKQIRAVFDDDVVRVYQAYCNAIADATLAAGKFVAPFGMRRMTWIKPSFLWMMYRSGWGHKEPNQSRILAIDITREGFEWALSHASLSQDATVDASKPVRVQWDPERGMNLERLSFRSIQIGLKGDAVRRYVQDWTVSIAEVTNLAHRIETTRNMEMLPQERPYPVPHEIAERLGMYPAEP
jgi:hypothetical protein